MHLPRSIRPIVQKSMEPRDGYHGKNLNNKRGILNEMLMGRFDGMRLLGHMVPLGLMEPLH